MVKRILLGLTFLVAVLLLAPASFVGAQIINRYAASGITGTVAATNGGTGNASYAIGDLLYASSTTALSKLNDVATGQVLVSGGVNTAPAWSASPTLTSLTTSSGSITSGLSIIAGASGNIQAANGRYFTWASRGAIGSTADKLVQILDTGATTGLEDNGGTPTLGTCTGGTLTSGSHNGAIEVTGTTGGSCVINFGTPNFTNTPFCVPTDETAGGTVNVTAKSASSITVANITSGHGIMVLCRGRIGT